MKGFGLYNPPASGGGSPVNSTDTYEAIGYGTSGSGTTITGNATANTKGSWSPLAAGGVGGITVNALSGFHVQISFASSAVNRYGVDISVDGGATVLCPNLYAQPGLGTSGSVVSYYIPIPVAAGADVRARCAAALGNTSCVVVVTGVIKNSTSRPGFTTMTALNFDTANTRPSSTDVPTTGAWVLAINPTVDTYGALILAPGSNGTQPTTNQMAIVSLGTGASGSEVSVCDFPWIHLIAGAPYVKGGGPSTYNNVIPAGTRLSVRCSAVTTGDNIRISVYGFS